jgi:hypothetical protein
MSYKFRKVFLYMYAIPMLYKRVKDAFSHPNETNKRGI